MAKNFTEEEYRKALEIWKKENPDKDYSEITQKTKIEVNGKMVPIGTRISSMRLIYKKYQAGEKSSRGTLTEEQIAFWKPLGLLEEKVITEEEYRKALEIWKKENPDKDYSEISYKTKINLNGKEIFLGTRIINLRSIYKAMKSGEKHPIYKDLTAEQIAFWKPLGLLEEKVITEEDYRKALEIWKKENPDKDYTEIRRRTKVNVDGKEINLGNRISDMRYIYNVMQKGQELENRNFLTKEQIAFWKPLGLLEEKTITEKEYREALEVWKKENPEKDYSKITRSTEVVVDGKIIKLGHRIKNMRQIYSSMQKGKKHASKDLTKDQLDFWKPLGVLESGATNSNSQPKLTLLEKYIEIFNGDNEKATRVVDCLNNLKEKKKSKQKREYNVDNLLKEFDVDLETLDSYLSRTKEKTGTKSATLMYDENISLREFCIKNGYNYDVIARAIKLHDFCPNDTLEQLINRSIISYNIKGQKEPATWVYEKYGILVKHILIYLNLDSVAILKNMTDYVITLEEAIRHDVFRLTVKEKEYKWLEELYNYLIEEIDESKEQKETEQDLINKFFILVQEYKLEQEEYQILWNVFNKYTKTMSNYQIVDVGLEVNQIRKLKKISDYRLGPEDIEESFFIPLAFDNNVLLGRKSELYLRRQLLRQYIIDWDYYTDLEKENIRLTNQFTDEEMKMIESTRKDINEMIEKTR